MKRPNILWFSLEDTSPRFGGYGDRLARTPNLDRLVADGCRYDRAFSVAGVCAPSRATIITGMYATFIGAQHQRTTHTHPATPELPTPYECCPPPYVKCFTEYLRAAGYYCTNNVKTDYQFSPPFTAWDEQGPKAHWRGRAPGQPFFSVFNPTGTHESGQWSEKDAECAIPGEPRTDPAAVVVPPWLPDTPETRRAIARQYDNIARSDRQLGERLRELAEDGRLDDTVVVVWSDHGEGLPRAKRWPYDSGIRIPLIVRWPKWVPAGTNSDRLVSLIDLAPTMLAIAGVPAPAHLQGTSFLDGPERDYVFATRDRYDEAYDMVRAVRDRRFKYIRHYYPNQPHQLWIPYQYKHPAQRDLWRAALQGGTEGLEQTLGERRDPECLYDLEADPHELHNVAGDPRYAADLARLRRVLDDWRRDYDTYGDWPESEMVRRWYPDGRQPITAAPIFIPIAEGALAGAPSNGGEYPGPMLIQLHCATQGASIGWGEASEPEDRWRLYTGPIRVAQGRTRHLRAKAIRIGYRESAVAAASFVARER